MSIHESSSIRLLSVVVPCFNEEEVIRLTHRRLVELASDLSGKGLARCEIVYVNDGSSDGTLSLLQEFASSSLALGGPETAGPVVRLLSFSRNFGHQAAMAAGLQYARGDYVVTIDADLQDPPELIEEMLRVSISQGFDVVHAQRRKREGETVFKKVTAALFYRVLRILSGGRTLTDVGDFRMLSRRVTDTINSLPERSMFLRGLLPELGYKQTMVLYERPERAAGQTKYTLSKMLALAFEGVTSVSTSPLRVGLSLGMMTAFVCLSYLLWIIVRDLTDPSFAVRGWPSLMVAILFLGSVQLFSIGILGEYIAQIHRQVRKRPRFFLDPENCRGIDEVRSSG
jgi:glycosyltransferase involved in cell wall biosynthesis